MFIPIKFLLSFFISSKLNHLVLLRITLQKNTVISPEFLVWKFCRKAQFRHSSGRIAQNYAESLLFQKIFTPGNQVKLRYFSQCHEAQTKFYKRRSFKRHFFRKKFHSTTNLNYSKIKVIPR